MKTMNEWKQANNLFKTFLAQNNEKLSKYAKQEKNLNECVKREDILD